MTPFPHAPVLPSARMAPPRQLARFGLAVLALAAVPLAGCGKSAKERAAEFGAKCGHVGFAPAQCSFLWAMARRAADDSADANMLAAVTLSSSAATAAGGR